MALKETDTAHLPDKAEALCLFCRRSFKSINSFRAHRDMSLPFGARVCMDIASTKAVLATERSKRPPKDG